VCGGGGGVLLGTLSTAATYTAVVTATGDYDDREIGGVMVGGGNRSTLRKPASVPLCPQTCPDTNPCRRGGKPATNRLSYGTASSHSYEIAVSRFSRWLLLTMWPLDCTVLSRRYINGGSVTIG
jgi:hypothetical protein